MFRPRRPLCHSTCICSHALQNGLLACRVLISELAQPPIPDAMRPTPGISESRSRSNWATRPRNRSNSSSSDGRGGMDGLSGQLCPHANQIALGSAEFGFDRFLSRKSLGNLVLGLHAGRTPGLRLGLEQPICPATSSPPSATTMQSAGCIATGASAAKQTTDDDEGCKMPPRNSGVLALGSTAPTGRVLNRNGALIQRTLERKPMEK